MPEGALLTHTVEAVLQDLAASGATGCLLVRDQEGDEAEVFLRDGEVYAVSVPGRRVMLGVRLMSRGALTPEALAEALEIQRTELQGWRLGELLVHLGYVELSVVEEFVVEHLKDALADLLGWPVAAWKFRKNKKTRQDVAPPTPVAALFDELRHRATTWETILAATGGPAAVPTLAAASPSDDVALGPNEWALLCKIDATRSVADLAAECGFTLFEAGQVVMRLVEAGLVGVPGVPDGLGESGDESVPAAEAEDVVEAHEVEAVLEELDVEVEDGELAELSEVQLEAVDEAGVELVLPVVDLAEMEVREAAEAAEREAAEAADAAEHEQADRAARERTEADDREAHRTAAENKRLREAEILHRELEALAAKEAAARAERAEARKRARAEMQAEQAATEAHNAAETDAAQDEAVQDEAVQEQPQDTRPDRDAAEELAWAEHANHLAAERAVAEEPAWAEHAAWLAAERAAAEEPAWADHASWLAGARSAAEESAWADHAVWVGEQVAAERAAAEESAWADHELWLSERAAEEAARVEAELQVAREQAERELAEEATRRARDAAEAEVRQAAERIAREEAERQERAESDRLAAEAAEQIAAAEAARVAAEQEAAEQEAARVAAEQEAARVAAEQEAARVAAEQEAARVAAEQEAARVAAEQEAARVAAEQEAARLAAEQDAARALVPAPRDDNAGAMASHASSLLTELNREAPAKAPTPAPEPQPEPVAAAVEEPEAQDDGPAPMVARDHADTAMLLRELSSLGFGAEDDSAPRPPTAPRPSQPVDPKKKRKGLFGRG